MYLISESDNQISVGRIFEYLVFVLFEFTLKIRLFFNFTSASKYLRYISVLCMYIYIMDYRTP